MQHKLLEQYKDAKVAPLVGFEQIQEDIQKYFTHPDMLIDTDTTTSMSMLLGVYFAPYAKNGKPRPAGGGLAIRVKKNEYAFSTVNAAIQPDGHIDVFMTWAGGKIQTVAMSVNAASDFKDVVSGKAKSKVRKNTLQPELCNAYMDDPKHVAASLRVYTVIRGDGTREDYGHVTGALEGKVERDTISPDLYPYLKVVDEHEYAGGVLRTFTVQAPESELERYKVFLELEECYRTVQVCDDELKAAKQPYLDRIAEIEAEAQKKSEELRTQCANSPEMVQVNTDLATLYTELEDAKKAFHAVV